jgi:SSS family solute:Na+ symporter
VPGLVAPRLFPNLERPDLVFPTLVEKLLPTGLVGLVMAGLIAAVMGHMSGAVNSVTTIATIDFYLPWKHWQAEKEQHLVEAAAMPVAAVAGRDESSAVLDYQTPPPEDIPGSPSEADRQAVRFGRIFGVLAIILGVICALLLTQHSKKPIFIYLLNAYGYFTPGIATMFLVGILWKRTTSAGALAAGILTIPMSVVLQKVFPNLAFMNRTGIVFWTCIVVCVLVSLCTARKSDAELKGLIWSPDVLRLPPEERAKYRGIRRPFIWWMVIQVIVLFFYIRFS